jgi:hypothetical protein
LQSRYSAVSVELGYSTKFPGQTRLRATIPRLRNDLNEVFSPLSVFARLPGGIYLAQFERPDDGG